MREGDVRFIGQLVDEFPGLRPALDEHIEDNYGKVLAHPFLADALRLVLAMLDDGLRRVPGLDVQRMLEYLERRFTEGDEDLQELISTGSSRACPAPTSRVTAFARCSAPRCGRRRRRSASRESALCGESVTVGERFETLARPRERRGTDGPTGDPHVARAIVKDREYLNVPGP
ncbi:MAG: hypothetical protein MSC31_02900 [Solirubrobacteraceae bacterium MAG38_C4-C5]|nr:hypothetical protein [Candidatus Siliceabacter maunaloa]